MIAIPDGALFYVDLSTRTTCNCESSFKKHLNIPFLIAVFSLSEYEKRLSVQQCRQHIFNVIFPLTFLVVIHFMLPLSNFIVMTTDVRYFIAVKQQELIFVKQIVVESKELPKKYFKNRTCCDVLLQYMCIKG